MKRKRTAAEKKARRECKEKFTTIFLNGRQKRVPRPPLIDGLPVEEFIRRNADPIWLHANERWDLLEAPERVSEDADEELSPPAAVERIPRREQST
jgi:hypothetical protein